MTVAGSPRSHIGASRHMRRVGYGIAVAVNLGLLVLVNNLLLWNLVPWLTDDFERLLPLLNVSITASVVANLIYMAYDAPWFTSLTQIGLSVIALAVAIRTQQVFPFDLSTYAFDWEPLVRVVLVVVMVALGVAILVETVKFVRYLVMGEPRQD